MPDDRLVRHNPAATVGLCAPLFKDGNFLVYLLDEKEDTLKPPDGATAIVLIAKAKHELRLEVDGDHLRTVLADEPKKQLDDAKGKATAVVTITVDGKPQSVRFKFAAATAEHEDSHPVERHH